MTQEIMTRRNERQVARAALRRALLRQSRSLKTTKEVRQNARAVLKDDDMMDQVVEEMLVEHSDRLLESIDTDTPIVDAITKFLDYIIANWDSIYKIIQVIISLFAEEKGGIGTAN